MFMVLCVIKDHSHLFTLNTFKTYRNECNKAKLNGKRVARILHQEITVTTAEERFENIITLSLTGSAHHVTFLI